MNRIAARNHHWYENENPENLPLAELAHVYQAQWYAQIENLGALKQVVESHLWTVNQPWTAQCWLPVIQAAFTHGNRKIIGYLVDQGADLSLLVGAPDDRASIVEMARYGNNHELANWLEEIMENGAAWGSTDCFQVKGRCH